jgi:hypothetical protein
MADMWTGAQHLGKELRNVKALGLAEGEVLSSGWLTVYYYVQILRLTGRLCDEDVARRATNRIRVAS